MRTTGSVELHFHFDWCCLSANDIGGLRLEPSSSSQVGNVGACSLHLICVEFVASAIKLKWFNWIIGIGVGFAHRFDDQRITDQP